MMPDDYEIRHYSSTQLRATGDRPNSILRSWRITFRDEPGKAYCPYHTCYLQEKVKLSGCM